MAEFTANIKLIKATAFIRGLQYGFPPAVFYDRLQNYLELAIKGSTLGPISKSVLGAYMENRIRSIKSLLREQEQIVTNSGMLLVFVGTFLKQAAQAVADANSALLISEENLRKHLAEICKSKVCSPAGQHYVSEMKKMLREALRPKFIEEFVDYFAAAYCMDGLQPLLII